ncbi:MAG: RNA methyltransferase [Actinobacteria bacterium]|nr:MAG: RNA methyltransferase [Actinomycetota bacterium]
MTKPTAQEPPIASPANARLRAIVRLHRRRERENTGRFVAEGEDLLAAADAADWPALERYCAAGSGLPGRQVKPHLLGRVSTLGSGTRALAVYEQRFARPTGPVCVYLHGVADPGNVGAALRAALAFDGSCVALGPGCADPYSPKAVRASMGAVFRVPLARAGPRELPGIRLALVPGAGRPLADAVAALHRRADDTLPDVSLLIGAEREGLSVEALREAEETCHIAISGRADSLNAAMALTVALYELAKHRIRR